MRWSNWMERRLPQQRSITLDRTRIFILPTWQGMLLFGVSLLVILLAINFESALNYAVAFWLMSMLWVAVHLTYRNLSGLTVEAVSGALVEVGQAAEVTLRLRSDKARDRGIFEILGEPWGTVEVCLSGRESEVRLALNAQRRGQIRPPRFRIENRHPFGLVVAWSYVHIDVSAWAYPSPKFAGRYAKGGITEDLDAVPDDHFYSVGSEDFHSLRSYSAGDPIQRIHWPAYSRDQLVVKHFTDYQSADENIRWEQFSALDIEDRLCAIRYYSDYFFKSDVPYSVSMPKVEIDAAKGAEQLQRVRRALAEFGYE